MISRRNHDDSGHHYVDPSLQLNIGLWTLFAGAALFLALRIWIKITRRHGLWWDDHILLVSIVGHLSRIRNVLSDRVTGHTSCQ
jgi:hypothetical protein